MEIELLLGGSGRWSLYRIISRRERREIAAGRVVQPSQIGLQVTAIAAGAPWHPNGLGGGAVIALEVAGIEPATLELLS